MKAYVKLNVFSRRQYGNCLQVNGIRAPPSVAYVPVVGRVTGKTLAMTHILSPSGAHYNADPLKLCLQQLEVLSLSNQIMQNTKVSPMGCIQSLSKRLNNYRFLEC